MKKALLLVSSLSLLALAGCNKEFNVIPDSSTSGELAVLPMHGGGASRMTKGYVEETKFVETYYSSLHADEKVTAPRTMQLSAYLTPQDGEPQNYFVDKTYSQSTNSETIWWNTNTVDGDHDPIYWPIGGTLDFLAYSISSEKTGAGKSQSVRAVWDSSNAAQKVTLAVPGENTQNDILFASAYGVESKSGSTPIYLTFDHAQAWLEFILTGSVDEVNIDGIVNVKRIELENVYNAGTLTISNNGGNTVAEWDFTGKDRKDISVDNFNENLKLTSSPKYLDMLIPQQTKADFVLYYTLGSDSKVLSYRFTSDNKTWLMGEKYIYKINISTSEVTVEPVVTEWDPVWAYRYTVKTPATPVKDGETVLGTVTASDFYPSGSFTMDGEPAEDGSATYTCDTRGAQVTLTATPVAEGYYFKEWSDGVTENPRTFAITEDVELPGAVFALKPINAIVFTASEPSTIGVINEGGNAPILEYSTDGYTWTSWDYSEQSIPAEKALYVRGNNPGGFALDFTNRSFFSITGSVSVSGNIMHLLDYKEEMDMTTIPDLCFGGLFMGCSGLVDASKLELPATTLGKLCYAYMFYGCEGLTAAPELPAMTLAEDCYSSMFSGCTELTAAPKLPAMTLANFCYCDMFDGCSKLTVAPELPATTVAESCYSQMFWGCTELTAAPKLPATTLAEDCYSSMFYGCEGLNKAPELPATELTEDCYSQMFRGCTSLTAAPELPATTLAEYCYFSMFLGCTELTVVPEKLPAMTLAKSCYGNMFHGCSKLTVAPELPATTVAENCYCFMFCDCSNLNYIKCLATDISADSFNCWVQDVNSTGIFVKKSGVVWPEGNSGIPTGWTVEEVE